LPQLQKTGFYRHFDNCRQKNIKYFYRQTNPKYSLWKIFAYQTENNTDLPKREAPDIKVAAPPNNFKSVFAKGVLL